MEFKSPRTTFNFDNPEQAHNKTAAKNCSIQFDSSSPPSRLRAVDALPSESGKCHQFTFLISSTFGARESRTIWFGENFMSPTRTTTTASSMGWRWEKSFFFHRTEESPPPTQVDSQFTFPEPRRRWKKVRKMKREEDGNSGKVGREWEKVFFMLCMGIFFLLLFMFIGNDIQSNGVARWVWKWKKGNLKKSLNYSTATHTSELGGKRSKTENEKSVSFMAFSLSSFRAGSTTRSRALRLKTNIKYDIIQHNTHIERWKHLCRALWYLPRKPIHPLGRLENLMQEHKKTMNRNSY